MSLFLDWGEGWFSISLQRLIAITLRIKKKMSLRELSSCILGYLFQDITLICLFFSLNGIGPASLASSQQTSNSLLNQFLANIGLIIAFGLHHSIRARACFKRLLNMPSKLEPYCFMMETSAILVAVCFIWQPMAGYVWRIHNQELRFFFLAIGVATWILTFASCNCSSLRGLDQGYSIVQTKAEFLAAPVKTPILATKGMHGIVRHPLMLGFLMCFWITPDMSMNRFVFSVAATVYVFIGYRLEERSLVRTFGKDYENYQRSVPAIIPYLA